MISNNRTAKVTFTSCRLLPFLIFSLSISCGPHRGAISPSQPPLPSPQPGVVSVIKVTENSKYQLEAIFSGEEIEVADRTEKVIEYVTIRSKATGDSVKYSRDDGPAESDSEAYFTEVWSRDEEWLVLPLGRFSGFCIIRAKDALSLISKQSCTDNLFTRLSTKPKLLLWHGFEKWDGNAAFVFKAGLSGQYTRLRYDLTTGRLTVLDPNAVPRHIEAWNDKKRIAVVRKT